MPVAMIAPVQPPQPPPQKCDDLNYSRAGQRFRIGQRLGHIARPQPATPLDQITVQQGERRAETAKSDRPDAQQRPSEQSQIRALGRPGSSFHAASFDGDRSFIRS